MTSMKSICLFYLFALVHVGCSQSLEDNIVLVNVKNGDKLSTSNIIFEINKLEPKVISVDMSFPDTSGSEEDIRLFEALDKCSKLILPIKIRTLSNGKDVFVFPNPMEFMTLTKLETGFVSAQVDENPLVIPKKFTTQHSDINGNTSYHFSVITAMCFDSIKTKDFISKHPSLIDVDFDSPRKQLKIFSESEVLNKKVRKEDIEGKIVMIGFLGPGDRDKFYSPNSDFKKLDMYGLEYLAIIVAQILSDKN